VLAAFSKAAGRLILREETWGAKGDLARGVRSITTLSRPFKNWLVCSLSELSAKKIRQALRWSTVVAPLSFFLEVERGSRTWRWFADVWLEIDAAK